jgi:hypothetical protein
MGKVACEDQINKHVNAQRVNCAAECPLFNAHAAAHCLTLVTNHSEGMPMNKADKAPHPPSRWFAGWRSEGKTIQDDPADVGTAFGLEMSLNAAGQLTEQTEPAAASTQAQTSQRPGLMHRLAGRRKTAD